MEMLDYEFLDKCTDPDLIRAIVRKLNSGEEGIYPDLVKVCAPCLLHFLNLKSVADFEHVWCSL